MGNSRKKYETIIKKGDFIEKIAKKKNINFSIVNIRISRKEKLLELKPFKKGEAMIHNSLQYLH